MESKKKSKFLRNVGIVLLVLLIVIALVWAFIGSIIKTSIEQVGSTVTKCKIEVKNVDLSLLGGKLTIDDFVVYNPEGFKTDNAFKLTKVYVDLKASSIFSDRIIINDIQIVGPEITYEVDPLKMGSNLGKIQENVESLMPAKDKEDKEEKKDDKEKPGKKIQIGHLIVKDGKINLSATFIGGNAMPVPLSDVDMKDIGKDKDVSTLEATAQVLNHTLTSVIDVASNAIKSLGANIGSGIKGAGSAIKGVLGFDGGGKKNEDNKAQEKK